MKTSTQLAIISLTLLAAQQVHAWPGQSTLTFYAGDNLFVSPYLPSPNQNLSSVFVTQPPEGTTVSLWNPTSNTFDVTSTFHDYSWSLDFPLPIGTGARVRTPSAFNGQFSGEFCDPAGEPFDGGYLLPPPVFSGPNGIYLLGDKCAVEQTGEMIFYWVLGRWPNVGEQITRLDASTQTYITSTFREDLTWDTFPSLGVGEAAFFNVGPVPEPSVAALAVLGLGLLGRRVCRKA